MIKSLYSNIEIKSKGDRHNVFVGGVQMKGVTNVAVDYQQGEIVEVTIKAYIPNAETKEAD